MLVPNRVRIKNVSNQNEFEGEELEYYLSFVGKEYQVINNSYRGADYFQLPIPLFSSTVNSTWYIYEVEILDWIENDIITEDYGVITISLKEYNDLIEYKAKYNDLCR